MSNQTGMTMGNLTGDDVVTAGADASLVEVAEQMMERWVRHVPVEEDGRLVGMVSARDVLGALTRGTDGG